MVTGIRSWLVAGWIVACIASPSNAQGQLVHKGESVGPFTREIIAGIPHLVDSDGFIIYPAFCPTACRSEWVKIESGQSLASFVMPPPSQRVEGQHHIGAIRVKFDTAGSYAFEYYLEPLMGKFLDLRELEIVVLPDRSGILSLGDVIHWDHYPYTRLAKTSFNIATPGVYIIGFGPAIGSALTEDEAHGIQSGFTLKYRLTPVAGASMRQSDMDVTITAQGDGTRNSRQPAKLLGPFPTCQFASSHDSVATESDDGWAE